MYITYFVHACAVLNVSSVSTAPTYPRNSQRKSRQRVSIDYLRCPASLFSKHPEHCRDATLCPLHIEEKSQPANEAGEERMRSASEERRKGMIN